MGCDCSGELFVEYQLAAQAIAAEAGGGGGGSAAVMMAAYGDIGPGYIGTAASYSYGPRCCRETRDLTVSLSCNHVTFFSGHFIGHCGSFSDETAADNNNSRVTADVEPVLMGGIRRLLEGCV